MRPETHLASDAPAEVDPTDACCGANDLIAEGPTPCWPGLARALYWLLSRPPASSHRHSTASDTGDCKRS